MGLDFSHGGARWGYGGFNAFRSKLAKQIGIDWECLTRGAMNPTKEGEAAYKAEIKKLEDLNDPIFDLLNHSDCDGDLTPEQCNEIWPRLAEMIKDWEDSDYDKIQALKLIQGMRESAAAGENLEFC